MKWFQRSAFHKQTYAERYPETWARLRALPIGIGPETGMHDTVLILLDHIDACYQRIEHLELEKDFN